MSTYVGEFLQRVSGLSLLAILALAPRPADAVELFGGIGTTGLEIGVGERVGPNTGLRLSGEFLDLSRDFERNGASYDTKLKFSTLAVYGDYFLGDRFRLTAGAQFGTRKASGNAVASNGTITINGVTYPAAGESVDAEAKFPSTTPYLGIGWGHAQTGQGLSFYVDAGVLVGKADAKITPSAGLLAAAGQANIDAEQRNLQESVDKLKLFPAVKFGIGYKF
ncbi:hypothetical protein [Variovorax sp. YR752]|uniref:hypothetical protein n=1 Tax=Variovorax sp. YR752 TaxID=1884383 RepID=UPI0031380A40